MGKEWSKLIDGGNIWVDKYFSPGEFNCKCCGIELMDHDFILLLCKIRADVGKPFNIASGYRCPGHNKQVSSTGRNGPHTTGRSADIRADGKLKFDIIESALKLGVTRIGVGKTFVHLDDLTDGRFSQRVIWGY